MFNPTTRRAFLKTAAAGGALGGLGNLSFLSRLAPVSAAEARLETSVVQCSPEIEPIVRLLEDTPRERLLEEVAARIRGGLSYREVLAALLLAGVRNVQPRPSVGFKFHAVLVVNSAHLASMSSPDEHRWLPIFWALDHFKNAQADDVSEGDWTMAAVDESRVPSPARARQALIDGLDNWDPEAVDAAIAGMARSAGTDDVFELLFRYGSRDFRDIGHKAIFVANSRRTLECIGWQHAEPVLRSLVYALVHHDGDNPARSNAEADRPWRENVGRAAKIRSDWLDGKPDQAAMQELLTTLREGSDGDACENVVELINRGTAVQSIWDALMLGSGELLFRQPGIVALHAVTSSNALRYAFDTSANDDTRRMLLLQNAAFLPLFRNAMQSRGKVEDRRIDVFEAAAGEAQTPTVNAIFAELSRDRLSAAQMLMSYLAKNPDAQQVIDAARVLVFLKGTNAHDYKFSSAVLEDYRNVSPAVRDRFLAASLFQLRGSGGPDNQLVQRTRAALTG